MVFSNLSPTLSPTTVPTYLLGVPTPQPTPVPTPLPSQYPTSLPTAPMLPRTYLVGVATTMVANNLLGYLSLPLSYTVGFDINPFGIVSSNYASIIHLTATNGDCCRAGDRLPGFWFSPNALSLYVSHIVNSGSVSFD